VLLEFSATLDGAKDLVTVGGATTVTVAFDVLPVPPLVEVTTTLLFFTPAVVPVTFAETVHEEPGAKVAPDKLIEPGGGPGMGGRPGLTMELSAVPLQVLAKLLGVATTSPAGSRSLKATPVKVRPALVLVRIKVKLVVPLSGMVAAPKAFAMVGGLMTVRLAEEVLPLPASEESMVTLLVKAPSLVP
jgi:hypothetical protein